MKWWFDKRSKPESEAKGASLRYEDIPEKTDKRIESMAYPQIHSAIPAASLKVICNRYAGLLHALLDQLPFSGQQIDDIVMPVLQKMIELVHLIPASETHHHPGIGGCLVHQLECAAAAVKIVKSRTFRNGQTLEENYHNQNRILLVAVLVALTHDVGKIFDIRVVDADDHEWAPEQESLMDWLVRCEVKEYFVTWLADRQHKTHQLRSLRLAYGRIFTPQLIKFVDTYPHSRLLCAFDEAVAQGTGVFADILRQAEERSIANDAEVRRHLMGQYTQASSPLIQPMLAAMRDLLGQKAWSVNTKFAPVFVTNEGVFLRLDEKVVLSVRRQAETQSVSYLPGTTQGFARVLAEAGCLEANPEQRTESQKYVWPIRLLFAENKRFECLKFTQGQTIFHRGILPEPVAVHVENSTGQSKKPSGLRTDFRAPTGGFTKDTRGAVSVAQTAVREDGGVKTDEMSDAEIAEIWKDKPDAATCQRFVARLCDSLCLQLRRGKGNLVVDVQTVSAEEWSTSSTQVEEVLKRHCIDLKTFEMLLQMRSHSPFLQFSAQQHRILCRMRKNS